jgi:hypothetical protein
MENKNLKDYALMCECSEKVASFGILADFLKKGVMDYYSYKSTGAEMPLEEKEILEQKYDKLQDYFKEIV